MLRSLGTRRASFLTGIVIGLALAGVFLAGFGAGMVVDRQQTGVAANDANLRDFLNAYDLVTQRSYYRPFNRKRLIYAAIDGMLAATGDPHTLFFSPQQNQVANQQLNGSKFSGIGAIVVPTGHVIRVLTPLPDSPAARARLRQGDLILSIDGHPVSTMSGTAAIASIHGRVGSDVKLTVRHAGKLRSVSLIRRTIAAVTAYGWLAPHHIGVITDISFGASTSRDVASAIKYVRAHGARKLILDLRSNPGGYVDAAEGVVSQFLSHGVIAYEKGPHQSLTPLYVHRGKSVTHMPMVVLVNGGTASAAEITAAALRDHGRAILIGTRTYGKGSMQSIYSLPDGSTIRITDRLWLTPDKTSVQHRGLKPDIVVHTASDGPFTHDAQLAAAESYLAAHGR